MSKITKSQWGAHHNLHIEWSGGKPVRAWQSCLNDGENWTGGPMDWALRMGLPLDEEGLAQLAREACMAPPREEEKP